MSGEVEWLSLPQWAERVGVHRSRASVWAREGRIEGARLVGGRYVVPEEAPRPEAQAPGRKAGSRVQPPNGSGKL